MFLWATVVDRMLMSWPCPFTTMNFCPNKFKNKCKKIKGLQYNKRSTTKLHSSRDFVHVSGHTFIFCVTDPVPNQERICPDGVKCSTQEASTS